MKHSALWLSVLVGLAGCKDSSGPSPRNVSLAVNGGTDQFGTVNSPLAEPLQVVVTDPVTKETRENITVTWRVSAGTGASVTPATSVTGPDGVASTTARLGAAIGTYTFEASADNLVGGPARFSARSVPPPAISALSPRTANTGDTITITGTNFSPGADENIVLFGGFRGRVVSATATALRVVVPACLPTRTIGVQTLLGAVGSNTDSLSVRGTTPAALTVGRGEAVVFADPREMQCQRLAPQLGSLHLVIPQNVSEVVGTRTPFDLVGVVAFGPIAAFSFEDRLAPALDPASAWEAGLRSHERRFPQSVRDAALSVHGRATSALIDIGDKRTFKVYDKNRKWVDVEAEVKHISQRAIIYQDLTAPAGTAGGFTTADFQALGSTFDSPIYDTDVSVFGQPSDIDANGKIIILLTRIVNELTPRGASGFVAGFFYGCDLLNRNEAGCSGTNRGEMFYLFQPDPTGKYADARSASFVLAQATPVLAHEFQHLINFGARKSTDALWLSEALAHMAEDLVADVYAARGDLANAARFRSQNYGRATLYLRDSTNTSLISEDAFGTLQARGGAWLFIKYLTGHYGGSELLRKLTQTTNSSVQNVTIATGQRWSKLLSDFAVALWADDAPELLGATVQPQYTFSNMNLRSAFGGSTGYALRPVTVSFSDFIVRGNLRASSQRHVLVDGSGNTTRSVNLALTGQRGGAFAVNALPQVTVFRVR